MYKGKGNLGITKHGKSGKVHNIHHFTGKTSGKQIHRKGKGLTRKQRQAKRGSHHNKYQQFSTAPTKVPRFPDEVISCQNGSLKLSEGQ